MLPIVHIKVLKQIVHKNPDKIQFVMDLFIRIKLIAVYVSTNHGEIII